MIEAGWYPDAQDPRWLRRFDGTNWTDERISATPIPPRVPPSPEPAADLAWAPPAPPSAATVAPPQAGYAWAPPPPPPVARRRRRRPLILIVVGALVAAGLAVGGVTLFSSSKQSFTLHGTPINHPDQVLSEAEHTLGTIVQGRHGAESSDTRCYFSRPKQPASGTNKDDVDTALRCGPVLFVDGDNTKTYLAFTLATSSTAGGRVTLTTGASSDGPDPMAIPATVTLARPDAKKPPRPGTLAVPKPPAAAKSVIVASDLGSIPPPKQLDSAAMVSLDTGVKLISVGVVARYGHGDDARDPAPGQELIAFQVTDEPGEADNRPANGYLTLSDAAGSRRIPDVTGSDQYVVVGEPAGSTTNLVLKDAGYAQSISLPSGKVGAHNLTVLTRHNRLDHTTKKADVQLRASDGV
ncbi:MAG: hypothetical protein QOG80_487, partial [Pseudonocardiales bacterium]|nr:hypothetical protein [Pseudonocardiales bacterium]